MQQAGQAGMADGTEWHAHTSSHCLEVPENVCAPSRLLLFPQRTFQKSMENVSREAQAVVAFVCVHQSVCGCIRFFPPRNLPGSRDAGQPGIAMSGRETLLNKGK